MIYNCLPSSSYFAFPLCCSTPEGGILYVGPRSITYIGLTSTGQNGEAVKPDIKVFHTRQFVKSLSLDPGWGKKYNAADIIKKDKEGKYFAVAAEDHTVQIWDFDQECAVQGHNGHVNPQQREGANDAHRWDSKHVLVSYMCNRNVLSLYAQDLIMYCVSSNSYVRRPLFIPTRNQTIKVLACAPHNECIFAVGTDKNAIYICDFKKGQILQHLRGHSARITSLAWKRFDRIPDIDDTMPKLTSPAKIDESNKELDHFGLDIYDFKSLESEFGAPVRPRCKSKSSDDLCDFVGIEKLPLNNANAQIDFLEVCEDVKADLRAHQLAMLSSEEADLDKAHKNIEVTLADCLKSASMDHKHNSHTSSINEEKTRSSESIEVIQYESSDDAVIVDGDERKPKHEVLHHIYHKAEVHATTSAAAAAIEDNPASSTSGTLVQESLSNSSQDGNNTNLHDYEILLASIDEKNNFWLWDAKDGAILHSSNDKKNQKRNSSNFTSVAWLGNNCIVLNDQGSLNVFKLQDDLKLVEQNLHTGAFFNIFAFATATQAPNSVWCLLKNRKIMRANLDTCEILAEYGQLTLNMKYIAECPDDMNIIAFALNEKRLAFLDLSKITAENISIQSISKLAEIPTILAWNSDCTKLAYGLLDGKIGLLDVETKKIIGEFNHVYCKELYSLEWVDNYILAVTGNSLVVFNVERRARENIIMQMLDRPTALAVSGDYLIVGNQNGYVNLYRRQNTDNSLKYDFMQKLLLQPRYIKQIVRNPLLRNTVAVIGSEGDIIVLQINALKSCMDIKHKILYEKLGKNITSVRWSNFNENLMVTSSSKGDVCIWDLLLPEQLLVKKVFACPITRAIFLPSDENIIMCSGTAKPVLFLNIKKELSGDGAADDQKDTATTNVLHCLQWASKTTQCGLDAQALSVAEKKRLRKQAKLDGAKSLDLLKHQETVETKAIAKEINNEENKTNAANEINETTTTATSKPNGVTTCDLESQKLTDEFKNLNINTQQSNNAKEDNKYMIQSTTLLYILKKELNKDSLKRLRTVLTADASEIQETVLTAKLFGTNAAAKELLNLELQNNRSTDTKNIASICLTQMNLTLQDEIMQCIQNKTLTAWHVSLAPTIHYTFWQQCCKAFAEQLIEKGYIVQGATYMMAAHNKYEAIQLLLEKKYFQEALLFARVYLPTTNPIQDKIIKNWIDYLESTGQLEAAALICVLANDMLRGYQMLSKFRNQNADIKELLELIKQIGDLHVLLGEKKPFEEENASENSKTPSLSEDTN